MCRWADMQICKWIKRREADLPINLLANVDANKFIGKFTRLLFSCFAGAYTKLFTEGITEMLKG